MTELDLAPLKQILAGYAPQGRTALLPALHAAQAMYGYLPEPVASEVGRSLKVPLADVYGVIDFYALFYREPVSKTIIHVCGDPACAMAGADGILKRMTRQLVRDEKGGEGTESVTIERAPCLGLCEQAPALLVQGAAVGDAGAASYRKLVADDHPHQANVVGGLCRLLTANCGREQPTSLAEYERSGGYRALRSALEAPANQLITDDQSLRAGRTGRGSLPDRIEMGKRGAGSRAAQVRGLQRR